ncbi:hypothetical protein AZI86_09545 [Bdellovibrio bacteriovorus]|uniref:TolB protein n=1 Tax=Bdellovibrio bacteriovorus TaxID=959 RepID=A0A150WSI8_BDEBC|nr:PD40 domain-containing protein [Bdellovibrio bacteriovorus]KYG67239.1 hypothetical protein AZI86_09545 [Bdellovibrio bacteriovorus]
MKKSLVSAALFTFLISLSSFAQLEVRPQIRWKTLHTPHFEVIYNAEQQALGKIYAEKLEKAYLELRLYFPTMREKTVVVINDKTDITNGYATRIPYPHIMAFPVLPGPEDSLADTGDWAFELLAHEYTHILTFEPASGVMRPLRAIFGNIIAPNMLLPRWWTEGLAVDMETRLGDHGRLRSYYQDATIRAMVDKETFRSHSIAQANEQIPTWPEGMRPYLFGSLMWSQMIADTNVDVVGKLNERQGRRVPYFIETPAREYLGGYDYSSKYQIMLDEVSLRARKQIQALKMAAVTPVIVPKNNFMSVTAPAISPDGKHLAVVVEDDANKRSIKIISKENDQQSFLEAKSADTVEKFDEAFSRELLRDGPPSGGIQRISWFPNSKKFVYDKIDYTNRIERFSDLYVYALEKEEIKRLTTGLRGREPAVSADGNKIVFVKLEGGKTHLAELSIANPEKQSLLFSADWQERISYPIYSDDDTILYSLRRHGNDELYRFTISSKSNERLFSEYKDIRFVKNTTEGLLFTSGKSGVLNLYLADKDLKSARPVSNTLTALFTADMDPVRKEIFATQMTEEGPRVVALLPKDWQKTQNRLPEITPLMADRYQAPDTSKSEAEAKAAVQSATEKDYSPYGYLWPQYWLPFISGSTTENGVILSAQTSGFDPLKKHSYTLLGTWDTGLDKGSVDGFYMNQTTSLPVLLLAANRNSYLGTPDYQITDVSGTLAALPDVFWISKYASLQLGWNYLQRENPTTTVKRTGPYFMYNHSNYSKSGAQISPESGSGFYLGAYNFIEQEGYLNHSRFLAGGELYLSKYLPKNHSLMFRLNGVYTPEVIAPIYGVATESVVYVPDTPLPEYILRGYSRGQIFGRNLAAATAEYRFPIASIYRGSGTDPIFLRRFSGALITDAVAADGRFYNEDERAYEVINMHRTFLSSGVELKTETTIGYVIPVSFVLGYYVAFNQPAGNEGAFALSLQLVGF